MFQYTRPLKCHFWQSVSHFVADTRYSMHLLIMAVPLKMSYDSSPGQDQCGESKYGSLMKKWDTELHYERKCSLSCQYTLYVYLRRVLACSLKLATASPHLTFSEARPPTSLLARVIVRAVLSACCWHFSFSLVAASNSAVSSARLASSSYMRLNVSKWGITGKYYKLNAVLDIPLLHVKRNYWKWSQVL